VGGVPSEMFFHFFKSFSDSAKCNLNIIASGDNDHHKVEAVFKSFARAVKSAVRKTGNYDLPSTKGTL
jgi:imidazoleglycerol-phosphate dehydratase/histidinol-phosphatase